MITRVDARLRREAERFGFRFTCESCVAFDIENRSCSHAYPNEQHRDVDLLAAETVVFCKEFELA